MAYLIFCDLWCGDLMHVRGQLNRNSMNNFNNHTG